MASWLRSLVLGAAVAALSACGSVGDYSDRVFNKYYDKIFGAAPVIKPAELVKFTATAQARVLWKEDAGDAGAYVFSPLVSGGAIYVASAQGRITRYDEASGKSTLHIDADAKLSGGVGGNSSTVLVGTPQGAVLAFDREGKPLWKAQLSSEVLSAPQLGGGMVVVRGGDSRIFGLDAATGETRWIYQRQIPTLTMRTDAGVVIYHGGVFAGLPGGRLVALALDSGVLGWDALVAVPKGTTELERVTDIAGPPVIDGQQICAAAFQGRVACFEMARGTPLWGREISSIAGLTIEGDDLYVSDEKSAVVALDKDSGEVRWKQEKLFGRQITAPAASGRFIVVGDYQGYVHFMSRKDGEFAVRVATDGSPIVAQPVTLDEGVLVVTQKGGVFVIAVQ
ncbi:MAG TPA: outer membrane protein assembly factor BamB [Burkholderiales bacterium]|nr:outer membrane protein assembly factor BamB [Burkholderiales bacterium]